MNSYDLVQFACQLSWRGADLVASPGALPCAGIEQYWAASKCRLDRWGRELKLAVGWKPDYLLNSPDSNFRDTAVEILTSETLTRVWTAICVAHDRRLGKNEVEPVARSVLIAQLDARRRVLDHLARRPGILDPAAAQLNELRRQAERSADLLIAHLGCRHDVFQTAFNPTAATTLAQSLGRDEGCYDPRRWRLLIESIPLGFDRELLSTRRNNDLNAAIVGSILSCFGSELFDGLGTPLPQFSGPGNPSAPDRRFDTESFSAPAPLAPPASPAAPLTPPAQAPLPRSARFEF